MAQSVDFVIKAVDELTPVVQKIEQNTKGATENMKAHWDKVGGNLQKTGIAVAGLGLGIEALARSQAPMLEQTRRMSEVLDMTEDSMKRLIIETSNVTFPLNEVIDLMELGSQQGIRSAEALQEYASFWDMVGDATGENSKTLAEAGVALKAVGVAAGEEKEALAAFGYITQETTGNIGEFLTFLEMTGPQLRELGIGINETAAIVGALEKEFGLTARVARQEFRKAVNESNGDLNEMIKILGLTEAQFESYRKEVEKSSEVIERNAEIHEKSFTPMQKLQHWFNEVKFSMSGYIETAAGIAPLMTGIGSTMTIVGTIMKSNFMPQLLLATKAVWGFTASILANPLTWWIAGIGAVIAAIVLLWKNWEKVTEAITKAIDWIAERFGWLGEGIKWIAERLGLYKEQVDETVKSSEDLGESFNDLEEDMASVMAEQQKLADAQKESLIAAEELRQKNIELADSFDGVADSVNSTAESFEEYWQRMQKEEAEYQKQLAENKKWEEELRKSKEEKENQISEIADTKKPIYKIIDSQGNLIGATNMPQDYAGVQGIKLEKFHTGGVFNAPTPGGEGIALLRDKEEVRAPGQSGASVNINQGAIVINVQRLDDREINRAGDKIIDTVIGRMRALNVRFAR